MIERKRFGSVKKRRKNSAATRNQYEVRLVPYVALTLADMPKFKNLLYKAITTEEVFMVYNGKKYSQQYARWVVGVLEGAN